MIRQAGAFVACLLIISAELTGGCSFALVQQPRQVSPGRYDPGQCTTSRGAPAADVVIAILQGFRTIVALSLSDADYRGLGLSRTADITIGTSMLLLFATSANYGFDAVATCREIGGGRVTPYRSPEVRRTSEQRRAEEAAEEAAVQARLKAKAAADAKAVGEAAGAAPAQEGDDGDEP